MGKGIHGELSKRLNFDYTTKWYVHKTESVLENKTHKILWDFEIQTDHQIPPKRPVLVLIKKKKRTYHLADVTIPVDQRVKIKENKKID